MNPTITEIKDMFRILIIAAFTICFTIGVFSLYKFSLAKTGGVLDSQGKDLMTEKPDNMPIATFAGGCFWCLESEFRALDGILHTRVGYTGGKIQNPAYQAISNGDTGHAEAVEITFDPEKITYEKLAKFFLTKAHDPTQLNRQGVDVGTQYRSEIFYHNDTQKEIAERLIKDVNASGQYADPIVTKLSPAQIFWLGEDYHQQYYEKWEKKNGEMHPRVFFKKKMKYLKGE